MSPARTLHVYLHQQRAGVLEAADPGWCFRYDAAYLAADGPRLSLSLRRPEEVGTHVRNWFANLLPEADVRLRLASNLRVPIEDDFALLEQVGRECAGAVELWPPGERPLQRNAHLAFAPLDLTEIARWIERPHLGLRSGATEYRLSLAGAQDKAAIIRFEDGTLALPEPPSPSTHILKIPNTKIPGLVTLEALGMRLAAAAGLPTAAVTILREPGPCLLIERFDRNLSSFPAERIHQEDVCQALGLPAAAKYQDDGGPSVVEAFALIREHGRSPRRIADFLRWVACTVVLGNADAHAKNLSVLYTRAGHLDLAPCYDMVPTFLVEGTTDRFALALGGAERLSTFSHADIDALARSLGVAPRLARSTFQSTASAIIEAMERVTEQLGAEGADKGILSLSAEALSQRAEAVLADTLDAAPRPHVIPLPHHQRALGWG